MDDKINTWGGAGQPVGFPKRAGEDQMDRLIVAIENLTRAVENMPRSITTYPAGYSEPGGRGGGGGGGAGAPANSNPL